VTLSAAVFPFPHCRSGGNLHRRTGEGLLDVAGANDAEFSMDLEPCGETVPGT